MCTIYTIQLLSMKIGSMIVSRSRSIWVYLCVLTVLASALGLYSLESYHAEFFPIFSLLYKKLIPDNRVSPWSWTRDKARATRHCVVSTDVKTCLNLDLPYVTTRQL